MSWSGLYASANRRSRVSIQAVSIREALKMEDPIKDAIREAYAKANGDRREFERLLREDHRVKFLSPMMIAMIVYYAIRLWILWKSKGVHNPSEEHFQLSEDES